MKSYYINQLGDYEEITDFFIVRMIGIKTGSNGKQYLDLMLGDKTGEINAKKWSISDTEIPMISSISIGDIIKIKASVTTWQNQTQLRIVKMRKMEERDENLISISDYIKAAPEDPKSMYDFIYSVANSMNDDDLKKICTKVLSDNKEKLLYYPAATRNHHAEYAGLLFHTKRMLMTGLKVCEVYESLNKDLLSAGVILHDIQKLNEIISDKQGVSPGYSFEGQMLGHLVMGVKYLDSLSRELNIPSTKSIMLEHMILSHHYEPEFGSPKRPLFPEAEVLHYLDIMDARLFDMFEALEPTTPGEFSDRVWTLENRRLFKSEF